VRVDGRASLRGTLLLLAAGFVAAGCASQADLAQVMHDQRIMQRQLADTRASMDSIQRQLAAVHGKEQETRHADRTGTIEARLAALEQARGGAPTDASGGLDMTTPAVAATPMPEQARGEQAQGRTEVARTEVGTPNDHDTGNVPDPYRKGVALVQQREYDRAIQQFREFLRTSPDSPYAGNAHYWIGESYYTLGDYSQAILQYNEVRQHYPKSDRAAPSLLKIGLAFLEMGNKSEARLAFQKVVNDYPGSLEAGQAREKLKSLGT
jgi:tol-pal system protein YbgF